LDPPSKQAAWAKRVDWSKVAAQEGPTVLAEPLGQEQPPESMQLAAQVKRTP